MDQTQHDHVISVIATLIEKVDGINRRLDISNGRIAKAEDKLIDLKAVDVQTLNSLEELKKEESQRDNNRKTVKNWFVHNLSTICFTLLTAYLLYLLKLS